MNDETYKPQHRIPKFPMNSATMFNKSYGIFGRTESGKSVLARFIAYKLSDIPVAFAFCPEGDVAYFYEEFIDPVNVISGNDVTDENLASFFEAIEQYNRTFIRIWQKVKVQFMDHFGKTESNRRRWVKLCKKIQTEGTITYITNKWELETIKELFIRVKEFEKANPTKTKAIINYYSLFSDRRILLIFDDVMTRRWFDDRKKESTIANILTRGRHCYITSIFILHNYKGLGPTARSSFYYTIIMGSVELVDDLYENKLKKIPSTMLEIENARRGKQILYAPLKKIVNKLGGAVFYRGEGRQIILSDILNWYQVAMKYVDEINDDKFYFHSTNALKFDINAE